MKKENITWLSFPENKPEEDGIYEVVRILPSGREEQRKLWWTWEQWDFGSVVKCFAKPVLTRNCSKITVFHC